MLIAVLAVLGLRPAAPVQLAPQPDRAASAARAGKVIYDDGSDDCEQVSFNNDTTEIIDIRTVPCVRRAKKGPAPPIAAKAPDGMFGSMRKAFSGGDQ